MNTKIPPPKEVVGRVRVITYYERDLPYFLLGNRSSKEHPGWEIIPKEGFDGRSDKILEDTFYRGLEHETGIIKEDLISAKFIRLPREFQEGDCFLYKDKFQVFRTVLAKVGYPPPDIKLSPEHKDYGWFDPQESYNKLSDRASNRRLDSIIFRYVLETEFLIKVEKNTNQLVIKD